MKSKNKIRGTVKINKSIWLIWFLLVILWNYGYPEASAFWDVIVAVLLSLLQILLLKFLNK